jgi:hypothetical protein
MGIEEFNEEVDFQYNIHFKDRVIPKEVSDVVNRIREEKTGNK